jgi:iron-sulfur cluster assembly accessory protein
LRILALSSDISIYADLRRLCFVYGRRKLLFEGDLTVSTAAITTETPSIPANLPVTLTSTAIAKVREIMATQDPLPAGLRIGVVGGGCSGFQYSMSFENQSGMMDKVFNFEGLKVFVDATSVMYLNGCVVDYVETLEAAGFKFENPQVKSTCGCGSSFSV